MTDNVLLVTVGDGGDLYEAGRDAIRTLDSQGTVDSPATVTFEDAERLTDVFNKRTYALLRVIREEHPGSIRETARLAGRDVKNVHEELTALNAVGAIRFESDGQSRRPVFPYDDLVVSPLADPDRDGTAAAP